MDAINCSNRFELFSNNSNTSSDYTNDLALFIYSFHNHSLLILPIISIVLNGFCLFIFFDKIWKKSILSILLKYLSATEILFNFSGFLYAITKFINYPSINYSSKLFWVFILQAGTFSLSTSLICRNWTILHLAIYRFDCICRPLSTKKVYTESSTFKILWLTYILAGIIAFPRTFEYEASFCEGDLVLKPGLLQYQWYAYGYQGSLIFIIQTAGPVIFTSVLSIAVMRAILKVKKFRRSCSKKIYKNNNAISGDVLMIFICFAFFVFETPSFFSKVLQSYLMQNDKIIEDILLATIGNLFVYLDSVINIFVYIVSNPTFRKKLKRLFHLKFKNNNELTTEATALERKETVSESREDA